MGPPQHAWSTEFVGQNFYKYCGTPVSRTLLCSTMSTARCPHLRGYACFCLRGIYYWYVGHSGPHLSKCSWSMQVYTVSNAWIVATTQEQSHSDRLKQTDTSLVSIHTLHRDPVMAVYMDSWKLSQMSCLDHLYKSLLRCFDFYCCLSPTILPPAKLHWNLWASRYHCW